MGIVNATPDSFFDGGKHSSVQELIDSAFRLIEEGADILDVGGESTRPGAHSIHAEDEAQRVLPIIQAIRKQSDIPISIDTRKTRVAALAVEAGATLINDVSALRFDPLMAPLVARLGCQIILMHSRGTPQTMQSQTHYIHLINDIIFELQTQVDWALKAGVAPEQILIDPGFGFAKTTSQNWELLGGLEGFKSMVFPMLVGLSRKRFLGEDLDPRDRLQATLQANLQAAKQGASILRVHDVGAHREMLEKNGLIQ